MKSITITNFVKYFVILTIGHCSTLSYGQDNTFAEKEDKPFSISATIDAYYRANLNSANSGENYSAPGTSFANLPGFALGMANAIISYEGKKVGFVGDLVFGPRGTDATFASPLYSATGNVVNQLYVYWNVSDHVTLTLGNFNTFLGYEVISPALNFNYSTSYLFSYGPFSHAGLKANFNLGNDWSAMLAIMNPTDLTEFNPSGTYAYGAQVGFKGQYLNFLIDDGTYEIDYTGGVNLTEDFFLGVNAAYYSGYDNTGFAGGALYPQYKASDNFTLGFRGEYFTEIGDFGAIGTEVEGSDVFAATLTGSVTIGDLIIKPELRLDNASDNAFLDNNGLPQKNLSSFVLAAIYQLQ